MRSIIPETTVCGLELNQVHLWCYLSCIEIKLCTRLFMLRHRINCLLLIILCVEHDTTTAEWPVSPKLTKALYEATKLFGFEDVHHRMTLDAEELVHGERSSV